MVDGYGRVDPQNAAGEHIHHPHGIGCIDHGHGALLCYRQVEIERRRTMPIIDISIKDKIAMRRTYTAGRECDGHDRKTGA